MTKSSEEPIHREITDLISWIKTSRHYGPIFSAGCSQWWDCTECWIDLKWNSNSIPQKLKEKSELQCSVFNLNTYTINAGSNIWLFSWIIIVGGKAFSHLFLYFLSLHLCYGGSWRELHWQITVTATMTGSCTD